MALNKKDPFNAFKIQNKEQSTFFSAYKRICEICSTAVWV